MHRLVIAGTQSGVGKTTIAVGLMKALTEAGYEVQPFKVGPDYIDPGFHTQVTGNISRNLDSYFLEENDLKETFVRQAKNADISIIEGVMGLFDGKGDQGQGSTAEIAKILKAPVILVINAKKLAQSGAALAYGYKNFDRDLKVKGVILNNIGSQNHYQMIKSAIPNNLDLKVVGYLPHDKNLVLPERHLGLVPTTESENIKDFFENLTEKIKKNIDLEQIMEIASEKGNQCEITYNKNIFEQNFNFDIEIGVAYDRAFNFYYQDNLDLLEEMGAKLKYFSPVNDKKLPDIDGLYLGGGFPESFLEKLATNHKMKDEIYNFIENNFPVYAECGGLMYLSQKIYGTDNQEYPMVGIIPGNIVLEDRLQAMGYVEIKALTDSILFKQGEKAKGHQFHYSRLKDLEKENYSYQIVDNRKNGKEKTGYKYKNLLAGFIHLHFGNNPQLAVNFLTACQQKK